MNYKDDSRDLNLEREFLEAAKMLEEQQATKERKMTDTELREEITRLKDEVKRLRDEKPKIRLTMKKDELTQVFYADGFDWPVCYNCSIEKNRPVAITVQTGAVYECTGCNANYLYQYRSSEPKEKIDIYS